MIKLSEPHFFGKEINYLEECINSKWISAKGKLVSNFETKIKNITNSPYALGVINCSAALKLSIRLLEPKNKDEILAPTTTFVSTINAIIENNCQPIFIDCDDKLLINLDKVKKFINKNTIFKNGFSINRKTGKKIIGLVVVHTFGNLVNLNKNFIKFCKYRNIKIIEVKKRFGDLGKIIASNYRLHKFVSWKPKYKKLSLMVKSSIKWEKKLRSFKIN